MRKARDQRGTVTAETAIVLPVAVLMLLAGMWVVGVVVAHVRCQDAARDTARALARGDAPGTAESIGARVAPPGAEVRIERQGTDVRVVVVAAIRSDRPVLSWAPTVRATGSAVVQLEPGLVESGPEIAEPGSADPAGGPGVVGGRR
jgi:Flp pilus assembly protein TadG